MKTLVTLALVLMALLFSNAASAAAAPPLTDGSAEVVLLPRGLSLLQADPADSDEDEETAGAPVEQPSFNERRRALLESFPPDALMQQSRRAQIGGGVLTGYGVAGSVIGISLLVGGLRKFQAGVDFDIDDPDAQPDFSQLDVPPELIVGSVLMLTGAISTLFGVPLLSHGTQMRRQLLRTVRGDEKLPRMVAANPAYWSAHRNWHIGQAMAIAGGLYAIPALLITVASAFAFDPENPQPTAVLTAISPWVTAFALLIPGLTLLRRNREKMEAIRADYREQRRQARGQAWLAPWTGSRRVGGGPRGLGEAGPVRHGAVMGLRLRVDFP